MEGAVKKFVIEPISQYIALTITDPVKKAGEALFDEDEVRPVRKSPLKRNSISNLRAGVSPDINYKFRKVAPMTKGSCLNRGLY